MPKRYLEFIESDEYLDYQGKFAVDLPGYGDEVKLKVRFAHKSLATKIEDNDIDADEYPEFMPLAELTGEPQFLAIDRSKRQCPVFMWEHETGDFELYAKSLDAFLGTLVTGQEFRARINAKKKELTALVKQAKAILPNAEKLFAAGESKKARVLLKGFLKGIKPVRDGVGYLCACFYLLGRCAVLEQRYEEAFTATCAAAQCGGPKVGAYGLEHDVRLMECHCIALYYLKDVELSLEFDSKGNLKILDYIKLPKVRRHISEHYGELGERKAVVSVLKKILRGHKDKGAVQTINRLVAWFEPEKKVVVPSKQATSNRSWWQGLEGSLRPEILRALELGKDVVPSDRQLIDILELPQLAVFAAGKGETLDIASLTTMSKLEELALGGFQGLSGLEGLKKLKKLRTLEISRCKLCEVGVIGELRQLETLSLRDNNIDSVVEISRLTKLKSLDMLKNKLKRVDELGKLRKLVFLDLSQNKIGDLGFLGKLNNLEVLLLAGNSYTDIDVITTLTKLQQLNVSGPFNKGKVKSLAPLASLKCLESLNFSSNPKISDVSPLASCVKLRKLDGSGIRNPLTGLGSLVGLKKLKHVSGKAFKRAEVKSFAARRKDVDFG